MNLAPMNRLAATLRLRDFDDPEDALLIFSFCVRLVAWWEKQERKNKSNCRASTSLSACDNHLGRFSGR